MIVTIEQIREACKAIAPTFGFRPSLISAMALQECGRNVNGEMDASIVKQEPGFYNRYIKKMELASTVEADLSVSWGVWQMMGESLMERKYFQWYFNNVPTPEWRSKILQVWTNPLNVTEALNYHNTNLNVMCEYACRHLTVKRIGAKDDNEMLLRWNGGSNQKYDDEVLLKEKNEIKFY